MILNGEVEKRSQGLDLFISEAQDSVMLWLKSVVEEHMAPSNETFHRYNSGCKMIYNHENGRTLNPLNI